MTSAPPGLNADTITAPTRPVDVPHASRSLSAPMMASPEPDYFLRSVHTASPGPLTQQSVVPQHAVQGDMALMQPQLPMSYRPAASQLVPDRTRPPPTQVASSHCFRP